MLRWILITVLLALYAAIAHGQATPTPTPPKQPIVNGIVYGDLDMNNFRLLNWDYSNWPLGGGGGGGSSLPGQGGHAGQFLQTDGTNPLWSNVPFSALTSKPTTLSSWGITLPLPIGDIPTGATATTVPLGNDTRFPASVTGLRKGRGAGSQDIAATANSDYVTPDANGRIALGLVIGPGAGATVQAWDADLDAIAALSTQTFGRSLLTAVDAPGALTLLGAQPADLDLTSLAAATGTNTIYYRSGLNTWSPVTISTGLSFTGGVLTATAVGGGGEITSPASPTPPYAADMLTVFTDTSGDIISTGNFTGVPVLTAGKITAAPQLGVVNGGTGLGGISLGEILYGSATNTMARLVPNSTATSKYLRSVGSGLPSWQQVDWAELSNKPTTIGAGGYGITDGFALANNFSELATAPGNKATARTNLGLAISGTSTPGDVEAWDADLAQLAAINVVAAGTQSAIPYRSAANTWGTITLGTGLSMSGSTLNVATTGGDTISDVTSSTDGQFTVFAGITGKHIKTGAVPNAILKTNASSVVLAAVANSDYAKALDNSFPAAGTAVSPAAWATGATSMNEGTTGGVSYLNAIDGYALLPPAANYSAGTIITYVDSVTVTNFGRNFRPQNNGIDKLDGQTWFAMNTAGTWLKPFIAGGLTTGQGTYQWKAIDTNADGTTDAWTSIYATARTTQIQSGVDASKQVLFNVENQPSAGSAHNTMRFPANNDSAAVPTSTPPVISGTTQFVSGFDAGDGGTPNPHLTYAGVNDYDLVINQDNIDTASILSGNHTVPNTGHILSIRVSADLNATGAITIHMPDTTSGYTAGDVIQFYITGTGISAVNTVTLLCDNGVDTFNGANTLVIKDNFPRSLRPDPATRNYVVSGSQQTNVGIDFAALTESAGQIVWNPLSGIPGHTAYVTITANDSLKINGPEPGQTYNLAVVQGGAGSFTLNLPVGSLTPADGKGVITISSGAGKVTWLQGTYFGAAGLTYLWRADLDMSASTVTPGCSSQADTIGNWSTVSSTNWATGTTTTYVSAPFSPTAGNGAVCKISLPISTVGGFATTLKAFIYSSTGTGNAAVPATLISTSTNTVDSTTIAQNVPGSLTTPVDFTFSGVSLSAGTGTTYQVVVRSQVSAADNTPRFGSGTAVCLKMATSAQTSFALAKSGDATAWTTSPNTRVPIKTWK